jgi:hypothetical protein
VAGTALALGLTACNSKTGVASGAAPPVSPAPSEAAVPPPSSARENTEASSGGRTPGLAVTNWVTQILKEDYAEACRSSAVVAPQDVPDPAKLCASDGDAVSVMKQLHEAWAKPGVPLPPEVGVEVDNVDVQGDSASVPDTSIKVGDKTLRDLELIGSSGDTSSFQLTLQVMKKDDTWYVGNMDMKV